jgi:hypothetical protein
VVVNAGGNSNVAGTFDVFSPPVVDSVTPDRSAQAGDMITISGENLAQATEVKLQTNTNVYPASFTVVSDSEIRMEVPDAPPRFSKVVVTTPAGTAIAPGYFGTR